VIVPVATGVKPGLQGVAMTTNELAKPLGINGTSIHRRVCQTGSYFGVKPKKLPNGRLIWPDDAVEQLIAQCKTSAKEADHATA
jgi:hypothetical protein